ncbi:HdeD family acid-resistance protein [Acinetobacter gerneri]|jgi:uncharacterized membrane protein HdeD (DUF308 family)|uniref:HdeD family acid-resistance protein n=1 Tax=Acinetobacter gerneri TaxID=202952 RepID=A0AAW8JF98_9GAMM|nr:HdeD family acid-resistance protein [Acinetobacter gerneri]MCH4244891.1 HdeD family acid-resistance protein [Acinetobacter gerneri]MDQ9008864.1 HdeD family acid-resistance protein [Acinetobacter gerneri]MDQ9012968.1 HdeD family acid-resistance protein [Acinetobacter gerneri]MDQ9024394.1 HdeD family acid-resistance protein [Acinetobacter gerneri]MDQ9051640.1 HdeD family acid-resistance protein [Acinetobacter gerneri]
MITVGNDLVRHQLQENRKWYLLLGALLVIFGIVLMASLGMATLTVIYLFGALMMIGGILHIVAAFKIFEGGYRWMWAIFGVLYIVAGYYAYSSPIKTAIILTSLLAIALIIGGVIRIINAFMLKAYPGWGWTLFSGLLTLLTGILIITTPTSPFWVLGMFLAIDMLFQGINYLTLAAAIKRVPPSY